MPVAGTSAGMAILGGYYYAPAHEGVLSSEILNDPFHHNTKDIYRCDFIEVPLLKNVITDTHLDRLDENHPETRYGRLFGNGKTTGQDAYFLQTLDAAPEQIKPGLPLIWHNKGKGVKVYIISGTPEGSGHFDLNNWSSASGGRWEYWFTTDGESGFKQESV